MKAEIRPRPESKQRPVIRPVSRHVNSEQAKMAFEEGKRQQQGSPQKAIELYIKATMYDPSYYQAYCNIGCSYRTLHRFNESRKFYQKAIDIKPDDPISRYNLGNAERLVGNIEEAILHYTFVVALKEQQGRDIGSLYLNSLINLGISFKNKDLFEKANECYKKAISVNPEEESGYFNYGMSVVAALSSTDSSIFQEFTKEQAGKATQLFKRVLEINPDNQMAEFQMLRMSVVTDSSKENIDEEVSKMKKLQKRDNCSLTDEIDMEIAHCMKLVKDYEASDQHFRKTLAKVAKKQSNLNVYDSTPSDPSIPKLTEQQGLQMIEQGLTDQARLQIAQLDQADPDKHVLSLTLELTLNSNEGQSNLEEALKIYEKHFQKDGNALSMESISVAGHKAVGHLLSLQEKYSESIVHYEYVGARIQTSQEKVNLYSSLGNDYEGLGDIDKAVEQYKLALETQPDSFELNYNIGCCLFDEQNFEEAQQYYVKFMQLLQKDHNVDNKKRCLYMVDGLISMAECQYKLQPTQAYDAYLRAWRAIKEMGSLGEDAGLEFENDKIQTFYLEWADLLEERMEESGEMRSKTKVDNKQMLLQVYVSLLDRPGCPDRDAILNNCATIYYGEKLFVNALVNFSQILNEGAISSNNLGLTYLHLHEHYMANHYIGQAAEDSLDTVELFNQSLVSWIYAFDTHQHPQLTILFPNKSDIALLCRLEYAKLLSDAVTNAINRLPHSHEITELQAALVDTVQKDLVELVPEAERPKVTALKAVIKASVAATSNVIEPSQVASCLKVSQNPENDLNQLIQSCIDMKEMPQNVFESLLNIFLFSNRSQSQITGKVMASWGGQQTETISLPLDRRVTVPSELSCREFGGSDYRVSRIDDLLAHLINWESELESKLVVLLKIIQKHYYAGSFKQPMECEYHFPRHNQWSDCGLTYMKIAQVVLELLTDAPPIKLQGKSLQEMTASVFAQLEEALASKMRRQEVVKLSLGSRLAPLTAYAFFHQKQDCLKFIKELQRESSWKGEVEVGPNCKQLRVVVSGILELVCLWEEPSSYLTVIRSFGQQHLPIEVQAAIGLDNDLELLKRSSEKVELLLKEQPLLNR